MSEYTSEGCKTCLYATETPYQPTRVCYCKQEYENGKVLACPNVCPHQENQEMKRNEDVPTNVALAQREEETEQLEQRYRESRRNIATNYQKELTEFEKLIHNSIAIINTSFNTIYRMLVDNEYYENIYNRKPLFDETSEKKREREEYKCQRIKWDRYLFGNCGYYIRFGSLYVPTPIEDNGVSHFLGLSAYGECFMVLKCNTDEFIKRTTIFIENSKAFYDRHAHQYKNPPLGFRTTWNNRVKLAVVKHGDEVKLISSTAINNIILDHSSKDSKFIEVHFWDRFNWSWIESVIIRKGVIVENKKPTDMPDMNKEDAAKKGDRLGLIAGQQTKAVEDRIQKFEDAVKEKGVNLTWK